MTERPMLPSDYTNFEVQPDPSNGKTIHSLICVWYEISTSICYVLSTLAKSSFCWFSDFISHSSILRQRVCWNACNITSQVASRQVFHRTILCVPKKLGRWVLRENDELLSLSEMNSRFFFLTGLTSNAFRMQRRNTLSSREWSTRMHRFEYLVHVIRMNLIIYTSFLPRVQ